MQKVSTMQPGQSELHGTHLFSMKRRLHPLPQPRMRAPLRYALKISGFCSPACARETSARYAAYTASGETPRMQCGS